MTTPSEPAFASRRRFGHARIGGLAWLACVQFFAAEAVAAAAFRGYSYRLDYISDLGAEGSPRHALMNASFMLQGALIAVGVASAWRELGAGRLALFGKACLAVCAAGVFLVGAAPEDVAPRWHYLGATANLAGCNLGALALGLAHSARSVRRAGAFAGGLGLAACAALGAQSYGSLGVGVVERLAAYPFLVWLAAFGVARAMGRDSRLA